MKKIFAGLGILSLVLGVAVPVLAAETASVAATVTPELISITVDVPSVDYGVMGVSETSDPSAVITATNDGNVAENFTIKGSNSTGWTLSDTAVGDETFMHEYAIDDDSYTAYTALHNTNYKALDSNVTATTGTQLFKLRLKTPSSTVATDEQTTTVTVLATEYTP